MTDHTEDEEKPSFEGQTVFKGDFNENEDENED